MMNICRCFVLMSRKYLFERFQFSFSVTEKETITNLILFCLLCFSFSLSVQELRIQFVFKCVIRSQFFLRTFQSQANHGEFSWIFYIKRRASKQTSATCTCNMQEVSSLNHHFTNNPTAAWILRFPFFFSNNQLLSQSERDIVSIE